MDNKAESPPGKTIKILRTVLVIAIAIPVTFNCVLFAFSRIDCAGTSYGCPPIIFLHGAPVRDFETIELVPDEDKMPPGWFLLNSWTTYTSDEGAEYFAARVYVKMSDTDQEVNTLKIRLYRYDHVHSYYYERMSVSYFPSHIDWSIFPDISFSSSYTDEEQLGCTKNSNGTYACHYLVHYVEFIIQVSFLSDKAYVENNPTEFYNDVNNVLEILDEHVALLLELN